MPILYLLIFSFGFAGASGYHFLLGERKNANTTAVTATTTYCQPRSPLSPCSDFNFKLKKGGKKEFISLHLYGFFDTSIARTAPTTIIAMMTPTIAGMKYRSAADGVCVGCVVSVAACSEAWNAAEASDE
jgi:hypothetical protein